MERDDLRLSWGCVIGVCAAGILCSVMVAQAPVADSPQVESRVEAMLAKLTLDEKLSVLGGERAFYLPGLPRVGMPAWRMSDGPYGVRVFGRSTAYAAGVSMAAAWDPELARRVGESLGRDARARGVHVLLAPGVNLYRSPLNGRNFEYAGEDPFLAARTAVGFIEGVQSQGVIATVKHFAANNSEFDRHNLNAVVDERTLRELYLPAFEASVREAGVGAVMDSYNLLNGEHLTQNGRMNVELLKKEWGFRGVVMSDWTATYSTAGALNGGLDLEMPFAKMMNVAAVKQALKDGTVQQVTIDDKVRRILRTAVRFGFFDRPQEDDSISQYDSGGNAVAYEAALGSLVLLKNDHKVLPLDAAKVRTIAVIGPDADPVTYGGGGSSLSWPFHTVSVMDGLAAKLGPGVRVLYSRGVMAPKDVFGQTGWEHLRKEVFASADCTGAARESSVPATINGWFGTNIPSSHAPHCVRWTGTFTAGTREPYTFLAQAALRDAYSVWIDGKPLIVQPHKEDQGPRSAEKSFQEGQRVDVRVEYFADADADRFGFGFTPTEALVMPEAKKIAALADAVVVSAGFGPETEAESFDRTFELPYGQEALIRSMAAANAKTIVTVASGGGYATEGWLPQVPALLQTWYFGQEGGRAVAEVLFGHSPEGKLPMTFERRWEENPTYANYYPQPDARGPAPSVAYKEGLMVGYRYYETEHKPVVFPFGFGLSYTEFRFAHLQVRPTGEGTWAAEMDVTNAGPVAGSEVAQVYVGEKHPAVERPVRELKGFRKLWLKPGKTQHVSIALDRRSFAYYDVGSKAWRVNAGDFEVEVGNSSENLPLQATVVMKAEEAVR